MSQADSDFEGAGLDSPFDNAFDPANEPQNVVVRPAKVYRKQEFNIYSLLLIVSFLMLLVSIILFFVEVGRFD